MAAKRAADVRDAVIDLCLVTEENVGQYCREKDLYPDQVKPWKHYCIRGAGSASKQAEQQKEPKHSKALERELCRKEKALAETAALLRKRPM